MEVLFRNACSEPISNQEAARYLETYKVYENKSPDLIKERAKEDIPGKIQDTMTSIRGLNKTDVQHLMENFGVGSVYCHLTARDTEASDECFNGRVVLVPRFRRKESAKTLQHAPPPI